MAIDRRQFLRKAGVGSVALASLPLLGEVAQAAGDQRGFHFVAVNHSTTSSDLVAMAGDGQIGPSHVVGDGTFVHFTPTGSPPFPIVASGTWKANRLLSFSTIGTYGSVAAGIVEMGINLVVTAPHSAVVPATLKVVCNLAFAGLFTGQPEGYVLTAAGSQFVPFDPPLGLTVFTVQNERRD